MSKDMIKQFKNRIIEIIGIFINLVLISKYLFDKITIRCEPCLNTSDCPPCQTDYMKNIWIYLIVFNALILLGFTIKKRKVNGNQTPST